MKIKHRLRRLRKTAGIRNMIRETHLEVDDLIYPIFVTEGNNIKKEITSLPGQYHFSLDKLEFELEEIVNLGIQGIILFGLPDSKDDVGNQAYNDDGIVQRAIRLIKGKYPKLVIITDVCLCQYTSHGHCGVIKNDYVDNDSSVQIIAQIALSHARAGADIVAPSDMMDGRVQAIREILDEEGYEEVAILAYSVKFASAFYGPFRDAVQSAPKFGDRKTYQMDPANKEEALREAILDWEEGADILMVKPAMAYLDIIKLIKDNLKVPLAAYQVSGEYSMIKQAGINNIINEKEVALESLIGIKRAGADLIITYYAKEVAIWLKGE